MKVLMLTWEYAPYFAGGLGIACKDLFPSLIVQGASLEVVLPYHYESIPSIVGRTMHSTNTLHFDNDLIKNMHHAKEKQKKALPLYPKNIFEYIDHYAEYMHTFVSRYSFDIIHAHDWMGFQAGMIAKKISGKPLIAHIHATVFNADGGYDIDDDIYAIEYAGMHAANKIIAVSDMMKKIIVKEYVIAPDKVVVIHNGMAPLPVFSKLKDRKTGAPIVLFLGRLTRQKGAEYFLKMVQEIQRCRPEVRFIMAGTGTMEKYLHILAHELGITDVLRFTGFLDQKQAYDMFCAADVFVMPSTSEPFGLTALEALSCGTPIIISNQSGVAEVLDHCIKVDYWDIKKMAHAVLELLDNPQQCEAMVNKSIEQIKTLTWGRVAEQCFDLYKKVSMP